MPIKTSEELTKYVICLICGHLNNFFHFSLYSEKNIIKIRSTSGELAELGLMHLT
jgi:hypothetical protein